MKSAAEELKKIYDELDKQVQQELDQYAHSTTTFLGSISVKEYSLYQNELGYHGGTLGSTPLKAIENIQKMYELGGITPIETESLTLALLNCADSAIGGPNLRQSLENYLLGGAALVMFDEGYTQAHAFLDNMPKTIQALLPKNLNLYLLNSAYIPASFILETIHQNLKEFYQKEIDKSVGNFMNRNKVIITNNAQPPDKWDWEHLKDSFQSVTNEALAGIDIQFIFMAGMLDIFENLGAAFKVKF